MLGRFSRTELLLGDEAMKKLENSRVAVFGVGGVERRDADDEPQPGGCGGKGNFDFCDPLRSVGADDGTAHHAVLHGL